MILFACTKAHLPDKHHHHSGLTNTWGAYQNYYENDLLQWKSPSDIAWVGSIQAFCLMALGVFVGPFFDAGYFRALLFLGSFFVVFGFMMTSLCTTYWQVFLAQGICIGLGTACLTIPSIALVPMYFTPGPKRVWAMSLATMGSGLGATCYPLLFQNLQPRIGFPWTTRLLGFISLAFCIFAIAVTRPRYKVKRALSEKRVPLRELIRKAHLTDAKYLVCVFAIFFNNVGFFEPLFYIQSYAVAHGMANMDLAAYLLSVLNASGIPGRLLPSYMAGQIGVVNTFVFVYVMSAASVFYWISATTMGGNVAFAVLYGFFAGGVVAFQPVVLTSITSDLSVLGTRLGFLSILKGIGSLVGPPIAGAILDSTGKYLGIQLFTGFILVGSVLFAVILRAMLQSEGDRRGWRR